MKFSICSNSAFAAILLGLPILASASTSSKYGQCVSGNGEFTFRGAVDAHFDLNACQEDAMSSMASGVVKSGQFNEDGDTFHYDVHCMSVHPDGSTVFVGAEIKELSKYTATHQDSTSFRKSLIDGDRDIILAYERKIHENHADDPEYIAALTSFLKSKGHTLASYEEGLGLQNDKNANRQLKKKKNDDIPSQVAYCAKEMTEETCDQMNPTTSSSDFSFDLSALSLDSSDEDALESDLLNLCSSIAYDICQCSGDLINQHAGTRRLKETSTDAQGTLALFQFNLDGDHSIAVKLGHDFDTTCVDFSETIDHGFFTEETVDNLTKGKFNLN